MLDRTEPSTAMMDLPDSLEAVNDHFYAQGWTDGLADHSADAGAGRADAGRHALARA